MVLSILGLVFGILSFLVGCVGFLAGPLSIVGLVLGIAGIVLSAIGMGKKLKGLATGGLITSIIGTLFCIIPAIFWGLALNIIAAI